MNCWGWKTIQKTMHPRLEHGILQRHMARRKRQLVLTGSDPGSGLEPLGTFKEVASYLGDFNTATDGSPDKGTGMRLFFGPGFVIELPTSGDKIVQGMVSLNDEDIALPVLFRMCRKLGWRMTDMESGRTFG